MLDREFDTSALAELRAAVLGYATACGLPGDRAIDVMLAVHELAANVVRHGAGQGRLRIDVTANTLRCEVSDCGPSGRNGTSPDGTSAQDAGTPGTVPWPVERGHGLWLVRGAADHLYMTSGPHGSLITAVFALPAASSPPTLRLPRQHRRATRSAGHAREGAISGRVRAGGHGRAREYARDRASAPQGRDGSGDSGK
jgi:anti-sigma regulatory factor (Ser/Thr protein kinase)